MRGVSFEYLNCVLVLSEIANGQVTNVLLVVAHPDDESM